MFAGFAGVLGLSCAINARMRRREGLRERIVLPAIAVTASRKKKIRREINEC